MEVVSTILQLVLIGIIIFFGNVFKEVPSLMKELRVEKLRGKNEQNLQIESYFREISGSTLNNILRDWSNLIDFVKDKTKSQTQLTNHVKELTLKTFMYGSPRTTVILGLMQQQTYSYNKPENLIKVKHGNQSKEVDYKLLVYTSFLIASLKEDFTGYEISPIEFLRVKLTDFKKEDVNNQIIEIEKEIHSELSQEGIKWRTSKL